MNDVVQDSSVELLEHKLPSGLVLAQATLNVQATLNSLSLAMIRQLDAALRSWAIRDDIAAVVLTGSGDKAFCAGGDIQALYFAMQQNHQHGEQVDRYPFEFFAQEYRLDYLIHTYNKPVICIGHGIVMGGGMGIFSAAKFRVLTETSKLALPEITIGLFPDAGASWSLSRMAAHQALFLGMTGSHLNPTDALTVGLGTHVVPQNERAGLLTALTTLPFTVDADSNEGLIVGLLDALPCVTLPDGEIHQVPEHSIDYTDLASQTQHLFTLQGKSPWIDRGLGNLRKGCPTTAGIVLEQLHRCKDTSLADMFRMEYNIASHCAINTDFAEGVRALLIDKDGAPRWRYTDLQTLPRAHVLSHFEALESPHPLADLGAAAV